MLTDFAEPYFPPLPDLLPPPLPLLPLPPFDAVLFPLLPPEALLPPPPELLFEEPPEDLPVALFAALCGVFEAAFFALSPAAATAP